MHDQPTHHPSHSPVFNPCIQRHSTRQLILITSILLMLGACSKNQHEIPNSAESSSDSSSVSSADVQSVADMATVSANEPSAKTTSPEVSGPLLAEVANPVEKNRQLVKAASIQFDVRDVYQTALQLEKLTANFSGYVEQKDIQKQLEDQFSRSNRDGTLTIFSKLRPQASMIVRIPSDQTQRFVNSLPPFMLFLNEQRYEAKRLQLKLLQEKLAQQSTTTASGQSRAADRLAGDIAALTQQEAQDRLSYSTIQLEFSQAAILRQTQDIQLTQVARQQDHFFAQLWHAIQRGAYGFLDLIVMAMLFWPLWLIGVVSAVLIWKYKKRQRITRQPTTTTTNRDVIDRDEFL